MKTRARSEDLPGWGAMRSWRALSCTTHRPMRCVLPLRCVLLLLLSLTASSEEDIGDLYDILGVDEAATDRVIKSAYRKLSLQHHPDKGGDPDRFKEITTAYEVLSDGEKRSLYDAGGMSAVTQGSSGQTDPWGRRVGVPRGDNVQVTVNVHLEDMYKGGRVRAKVRRRVVCRSCSREAVRNRRKRDGKLDDRCDVCGPTCPPAVKVVQRRMGMMIVNQEQEVPSEEKCKEEVANLTTTIEKGVPDGKEVRRCAAVAHRLSAAFTPARPAPRRYRPAQTRATDGSTAPSRSRSQIVFERASEQTPGHMCAARAPFPQCSEAQSAHVSSSGHALTMPHPAAAQTRQRRAAAAGPPACCLPEERRRLVDDADDFAQAGVARVQKGDPPSRRPRGDHLQRRREQPRAGAEHRRRGHADPWRAVRVWKAQRRAQDRDAYHGHRRGARVRRVPLQLRAGMRCPPTERDAWPGLSAVLRVSSLAVVCVCGIAVVCDSSLSLQAARAFRRPRLGGALPLAQRTENVSRRGSR
eukprot:6797206-Prymnesium_polylepis.1